MGEEKVLNSNGEEIKVSVEIVGDSARICEEISEQNKKIIARQKSYWAENDRQNSQADFKPCVDYLWNHIRFMEEDRDEEKVVLELYMDLADALMAERDFFRSECSRKV